MAWVSIREAAEMLKLSPRTIQRMVAARTLRSRLERGLRLVCLSDGDEPSAEASPDRLDPRHLDHLCEVFEGLYTLRVQSYQIVATHKALDPVFACLPDQAGRPTVEQWDRLHRQIKSCHQQVERLIRDRRGDPDLFQALYRTMVQVRILWGHYGDRARGDLTEAEQHGEDQEPALALLTHIILHLRTLLVGTVGHENGEDSSAMS